MADKEKFVERRRHKRFIVNNHTFTTISSKIGRIKDISMGGLSFRYMDSKEWPSKQEAPATLFNDDFFLKDIPLLTISDFVIARRTPSIITERQRRVKFGKLTPEQKSSLEYFIRNHTKFHA